MRARRLSILEAENNNLDDRKWIFYDSFTVRIVVRITIFVQFLLDNISYHALSKPVMENEMTISIE